MKAQVVSFHCVLKDRLGRTLSSSFNQDVMNQPGTDPSSDQDPRLHGLAAGLQNVRRGERRRLAVPAQDAYGVYDPELVCEVPRTELSQGERLEVRSEVVGRIGPRGQRRVYRVIEAFQDSVVLDGNHPLAGQDLYFEIEIVAARDACHEDFGNHPGCPPGRIFH
jgi:FKBP-type peptidyl-prolyl cis-trans isomerase SlyD